VGSTRFLGEEGIDVEALPPVRGTGLAVARGGRALGVILISDAPRSSAAPALRSLRELGLRTAMLTGDGREAAAAVDEETGNAFDEVFAELLPKDKLERLRGLPGLTAMVGDGINDAPALAAADVGIALGSGTDVAIEAAHITLVRPDLGAIAEAVRLGRRTLSTIRWNLFWAFFYNVVAIPAAMGLLPFTVTPSYAAAAMAVSSVTVVTNSLRLRKS
jgi:Cu+-exporting ATPase